MSFPCLTHAVEAFIKLGRSLGVRLELAVGFREAALKLFDGFGDKGAAYDVALLAAGTRRASLTAVVKFMAALAGH